MKDKQGFTIIELMIATAVLSIILLLATAVMINIGSLYYKGINQSRVQDDARSISDDLSQQLQLSGTGPVPGSGSFGNGLTVQEQSYCLGSIRYSYVLNTEIGTAYSYQSSGPNQTIGQPIDGDDTVDHVLWRDTNPSDNAGCSPADLTQQIPPTGTDGTEMISPKSRLAAFSINGLDGVYQVQIDVAYGDFDLLNLSGLTTTCNGNTGDQFCANASLTTNVVQRTSN